MWHRPDKSVFIYISDGITSDGKVAAFDMDWTLTRTSRSLWPKDPSDLVLLPNRLEILNSLRDEGYTIVIFTNQKSSNDNKVRFNLTRVHNFVKMVGPVIALMSTADDKYRKPQTGMWENLNTIIPNLNNKLSFYCGDAAGRQGEFSDSDKMFAQNIGINFRYIEEVFPDVDISQMNITQSKSMVLFIGMPGSGKTTYYNTHFKDTHVHINQDLLGSKPKCLKMSRDKIKCGDNVVIDCTNPGQSRRDEFYDIAKRNNYNITTIYFEKDGRGWNKLRIKPVPSIGYSMYYKYLVEPTENNTSGVLYRLG